MKFSDARKTLKWAALALFVLACASPLAVKTPLPTPISESVMRETLAAAVGQTAAVAATQTALLRPPTLTPTVTLTPSKTPTPVTASPTFIFALYTDTPYVPQEATSAAGQADYQTAVAVATEFPDYFFDVMETPKVPWGCRVMESPVLYVKPKQEFYATWVVRNTGTKAWHANTVDFVYKGGYRHIGSNIEDLYYTVGTFSLLKVDAKFIAPHKGGEYSGRWVLMVGHTEFCALKLKFTVGLKD